MPELIRVIAFYDGKVVMERDLEDVLNKLFGLEEGQPQAQAEEPEQPEPVPGPIPGLARKARQLFQEADNCLRAGDWAGYGKAIEELGEVLDDLAGEK